MLRYAALFIGLVTLAAPVPGRAETVTCQEITTLPTVISTGGTYCLRRNLSTSITSGAAITIAANNVALDCNNRKIGAREGGLATQATGIFGNGVQNVTIQNCSIRGFYRGIWIHDGAFVHVERNRLDLNTHAGIDINAPGSLIKDNMVFDTGGSTVSNGAVPFGINAVQDSDIMGNHIVGVVAPTGSTSAVMGIYVHESDGGSVTGNRIRHMVPGTGGSGHGIIVGGGNSRAFVDGNFINMIRTGTTAGAIHCTTTQSLATNNRVVGMGASAIPVTGCADGGGNKVN
jgi:hypothetical protein